MGFCVKCNKLLPPQLLTPTSDGKAKICLFCEIGKDVIPLSGGRMAHKQVVIQDYEKFLKVVKERNEILKKAVKGDISGIPKNILEE